MIKKTRNFVNNEDNNFNIKKLGKIKNIENSSRTRKFYDQFGNKRVIENS